VKLLDCICAIVIRLGADQAGQFVSSAALEIFKSFERVAGQQQQLVTLVEQSPKPSGRPDYMGHHRRLSSTLRQGQAMAEAAIQAECTGSSARSAAHGKPFKIHK
jgi:hypothetical protein